VHRFPSRPQVSWVPLGSPCYARSSSRTCLTAVALLRRSAVFHACARCVSSAGGLCVVCAGRVVAGKQGRGVKTGAL